MNYGSVGVVIGHEISHGFDDQGAQYDYLGRLRNWWTDNDLKQFKERGACVVDQFDNYFIEPGVHHNGKMVLGESIGDLGGAKVAFLAFQKSLARQTATRRTLTASLRNSSSSLPGDSGVAMLSALRNSAS